MTSTFSPVPVPPLARLPSSILPSSLALSPPPLVCLIGVGRGGGASSSNKPPRGRGFRPKQRKPVSVAPGRGLGQDVVTQLVPGVARSGPGGAQDAPRAGGVGKPGGGGGAVSLWLSCSFGIEVVVIVRCLFSG